jgi:hypothetical protein
LSGITALTLIEGERRPETHEIVEHLPERVYPEGESDKVPARLLPHIQANLSTWLPGWSLEHADDHSICDAENWTFLIRTVAHPHAGWGLQVTLVSLSSSEKHECLRSAAVFNRGDSRVEIEVGAPGCWTYVYDRLEYRTFLPAWLLKYGNDMSVLVFVRSIVQGVAARVVLPELQHVQAELGAVFVRPAWPGDDEAIVLARRHPINDGENAPDSFVWLDYGERAAYTTEESFRVWRSRLLPEDLSDKGVAGYSKWFEHELALRHPQRTDRTSESAEGVSDD